MSKWRFITTCMTFHGFSHSIWSYLMSSLQCVCLRWTSLISCIPVLSGSMSVARRGVRVSTLLNMMAMLLSRCLRSSLLCRRIKIGIISSLVLSIRVHTARVHLTHLSVSSSEVVRNVSLSCLSHFDPSLSCITGLLSVLLPQLGASFDILVILVNFVRHLLDCTFGFVVLVTLVELTT